MSRGKYYYFVSGLPRISMEDTKLQIEPASFVEQASTQLTKSDLKLLRLLDLEASIPILLSLLYKEEPQDLPIAYDQSYWEAFVEYAHYKIENKDAAMPSKFKEIPEVFLSLALEFLPLEEKPDKLLFEHRFYQGLYEFAGQHRNTFIKTWFDYRRTARNIILALNGRTHELDYAPWLVGDDELTQQLATGRGSDFGIGKSNDIFDDYSRAYEQNTVLPRERAYDALAWKFIDDLNFFQYFSIDKVLGYYAQLLILSRWLSFDVDKGKQVFFDTLSSLRDSFSFPAEFNIKQKIK
jgi:hypothetical protein